MVHMLLEKNWRILKVDFKLVTINKLNISFKDLQRKDEFMLKNKVHLANKLSFDRISMNKELRLEKVKWFRISVTSVEELVPFFRGSLYIGLTAPAPYILLTAPAPSKKFRLPRSQLPNTVRNKRMHFKNISLEYNRLLRTSLKGMNLDHDFICCW